MEDLDKAGRPELINLWIGLIGEEPPKGISTILLRRAVAYELQAKRFGGLSKARKAKLLSFGSGDEPSKETRSATSGDRLVREWNGRTYIVEVHHKKFVWNGSEFNSLSQVAKAITGVHWSGPRFFGLTGDKSMCDL